MSTTYEDFEGHCDAVRKERSEEREHYAAQLEKEVAYWREVELREDSLCVFCGRDGLNPAMGDSENHHARCK